MPKRLNQRVGLWELASFALIESVDRILLIDNLPLSSFLYYSMPL